MNFKRAIFGSSNANSQPADAIVEPEATVDADEVLSLVGMSNLGNTCYANSVLQALYSHKHFREAVMSQFAASQASAPAPDPGPSTVLQPLSTPPAVKAARPKSSGSGTSAGRATLAAAFNRKPPGSSGGETSAESTTSPVSRQPTALPETVNGLSTVPLAHTSLLSTLNDLFAAVRDQPKRQGHVAPTAFIQQLRRENELFRSTMHQDAHEFLGYLLNAIAEDVEARVKADPSAKLAMPSMAVNGFEEEPATWVHSLFEGVLTNETRCLTCETVTSRDESFLDLSIDIDENTSITACLRQFSASEMLSHTNKFSCDSCWGLQEAEKRMKIKKLPNVLALHLKRFKYQEESQRFIKLTYRVVFPLELRLFNTVDSSPDPDRLYSLWAIVVHIGVGPHAGHYVTIVRGAAGKWIVFDDENVSEIEESELSRYFGDTPGVGSGYVLFYQTVPQDDGPTAPLVHLAHRHRDLPSPPPAASPVPVPLATPMQGTFDIPPLSPVEPTSPSGQPASGINRLFGSLSRRQANGLVGSQSPVPPVPPLPALSPLSPRGALEVLADPERRSMDTASLASEGDRMSNSSAAAAAHSDSPPYARLGQDDSLPSIDTGSPPPSPVVAKESSGRGFGRFLRPKARFSSQSSASVPTIAAVAPLGGPPSPTQPLRHTLSMGPDETVKRKSKR